MPVLHSIRKEDDAFPVTRPASHPLAAPDMQSMTLSALLEMASAEELDQYERQSLGAGDARGADRLRQAIASIYGQRTHQDILCFSSVEEAATIACHALLDVGDHALVVTPGNSSMETILVSICTASAIPLREDQDWRLDLQQVADAIRPHTKLLAVTVPHTPTGSVMDRDTFNGLISLCRQNGIWLLCDEAYRCLRWDGRKDLPPITDLYEKGLSLNMLSRAYGLSGLRVGWLACADRMALRSMERIKHQFCLCNPAPSESLACIALRNRHSILSRNNALLAVNLKHLETFFDDFPDLFEWTVPQGGCVAYPRYKDLDGVEAFARKLRMRAGLKVLPSSLFQSRLGPTPPNRFRIGFGRAELPAALAVFHDYLKGNLHHR